LGSNADDAGFMPGADGENPAVARREARHPFALVCVYHDETRIESGRRHLEEDPILPSIALIANAPIGRRRRIAFVVKAVVVVADDESCVILAN